MVSNVSPNRAELEQLCRVFRLLSDPTRLRILRILSDGERHVTSLCQLLSLPQPTVSHHLGLLRGAGVATGRRAGKQVYYRLNPENVQLEPVTRAIRMRHGGTRISLAEHMVEHTTTPMARATVPANGTAAPQPSQPAVARAF
ncbi:MAG: winged helix-turn-helix transcriptional regulator [Phycisphaerales bacterium]|nr:winged helix-turn-helix transcriptional regulator [Phycisphaerales bacterium]